MWRIALLALSAAAVGAGMARRGARAIVAAKRDEMVLWAAAEARRRIRSEAEIAAQKALRRFFLSTAAKASVIAALWTLATAGFASAWIIGWLIACVVFAFLARDVVLAWPSLRIGFAALKNAQWRIRDALHGWVAGRVFAEALAQANAQDETIVERVALAIAGADRTALAQDIATAVSETAALSSWSDVWPIARAALIKACGGLAVYLAFLASLATLSP